MRKAIEFKREMNRNYMVLEPVCKGHEKYAVHMLATNSIKGLLPFHEKQTDGRYWYYYDITSKQPLERILESRMLTGEEIRKLISSLLFTLRQMEKYLLDEGQLCLEAAFIYVEPDTFQVYLCLIPGENKDFSEEFRTFAQYLLDHVSHKDEEAVVLAFRILKQSRKENFGVEDIEQSIQKADAPSELRRENIYENRGRQEGEGAENNRKYQQVATAWQVEREEKDKARDKAKDKAEQQTGSGQEEENGFESGKRGAVWIVGILIVLLPAAAFAALGVSGIIRYKWFLCAAELLLVALLIIMNGREERGTVNLKVFQEETDTEDWEILFREEETKEEKWEEPREIDESEEEMQTILLTARPLEPEIRKLVPVRGGAEIAIRYFPFLIGKSSSLSDYCLDEPEVSRLHLKIEETETGYELTDLNSTNGTYINNRLLEANETSPLYPGDEVSIAAIKYRFL